MFSSEKGKRKCFFFKTARKACSASISKHRISTIGRFCRVHRTILSTNQITKPSRADLPIHLPSHPTPNPNPSPYWHPVSFPWLINFLFPSSNTPPYPPTYPQNVLAFPFLVYYSCTHGQHSTLMVTVALFKLGWLRNATLPHDISC